MTRSAVGRAVTIVPPRPEWPAEFDHIAQALRRAADSLALRIDHIGSTALADMPAKDIIDVQLTVRALRPVERIEQTLGLAGYTRLAAIAGDHRPPGDTLPDEEWQKLMFQPPPAQRPTNLHVRALGRANQRFALLVRDYLRAHPASARAYARVKKRLAHYHGDDRFAYSELKDPVFDVIYAAAEDWAERVDWAPGPSDG